MSIIFQTLYEPDLDGGEMTHSKIILITSIESFKEFQELIQRGSNLWPDASADIKTFADIVTNGKPLQNYYTQSSEQLKTK